MEHTKRTKTVITDKIILEVEGLAEQGFNNVMIGQSLNIAVQTLSSNKELKEAIQRGKMALAKQVTESILNTLERNPNIQQLLVKRLCLFTPVINIKKPTNAKEALDNLASATKCYSDGKINESQLRTIEAVSNSYVKGYEVIDLEERVSKLEEEMNK